VALVDSRRTKPMQPLAMQPLASPFAVCPASLKRDAGYDC
jgi:hypothetical protein